MEPVTNELLLVSVCDFGWGSLGKVRLILDQVPELDVALYDPRTDTATVRRLLGSRHPFVERRPEEAAAALVVNDPVAADEIEAMGVPVVYVDSLPYLWRRVSEVPRRVAVYCAQRSEPPAEGNPLFGRDIHWIDPVVPRVRKRVGGNGVVVTVGGLHSHLSGDAADAYVSLVLVPLAQLLGKRGAPVAAVCGNIPAWAVDEVQGCLSPRTHFGPMTPYDFEDLLVRADQLIASPGSTTILQAAALRLPTLLLPPQNLSQILNARLFAQPGRGVVAWPADVLDLDRVAALRPLGEDAVLAEVYAAISSAADSGTARAAVAVLLERAIDEAPPGGVLKEPEGTEGARQVGRVIRQVLFAPPAR